MNDPANTLYPTGETGIWVLFDLREERAIKSLHLLHRALQDLAGLEYVDQDHAILIARPGGARELEA